MITGLAVFGRQGLASQILGSVDELLGVNGLMWKQSERPIVVVVELERQKNFADEVDNGPLIYGSGDAPGGFENLVLGVFDKDTILAIPGERKSYRGAAFLDVVDGNQGSGRIGADGNGAFHTAGKTNEQ